MNPDEERSLLELLAVCSTVFEDGLLFRTEKAKDVALRRIHRATLKAVTTFSNAPTYGRGA